MHPPQHPLHGGAAAGETEWYPRVIGKPADSDEGAHAASIQEWTMLQIQGNRASAPGNRSRGEPL
ncbi:MAG TPA: hypothetical protein PLU39_02765 [Armatimonadota bacterium]|jgi:hypothetical protein|nr:hypothetical protein [Armatimonadota bacterium]HOM81737.1 hypothetical protein [Armatimonadota bacterium]HOQ27959.1 hypothetical protein [Armatimonadota bacterium]HPO74544.1 hypothetical protein [Armatimonadota bacterium]HPT96768.1 hypothetical protein [Armatimonadota bacterium]